MHTFSFQNFKINIDNDLKEARSLVNNLSEYFEYPQHENDHYFDEKKDFDEECLKYYIEQAITKLKFVFEYVHLEKLYQDFINELSKYKTYHDEFEHISYIGVFTNPVVDIIQKYVNALCCHLAPELSENSKLNEELSLLERILIGTPKIIFDNTLEPKNEAEIRNVVYRLLIHVFPDTVREIPISKISKTYKPDIGIRKLKAAIEYKFADNLDELKKCIGGIFEDIQGYSGSEDWKTFYAVIYQTDHFMTQSQIEEEFKLANVSHNWKPMLVFGKGERKKKLEKSSSQH